MTHTDVGVGTHTICLAPRDKDFLQVYGWGGMIKLNFGSKNLDLKNLRLAKKFGQKSLVKIGPVTTEIMLALSFDGGGGWCKVIFV